MTFEHYYAERVSKWKPLSPLWQGNGAITEEIRAAYEAGAASRDTEVEALRELLKPLHEAVRDADIDEAKDRHEIWETPLAMALTFGDIRNAAKAYTALNKGEG